MKVGMTKDGKIAALIFWGVMVVGTLIVRALFGELRTSSFVIIPIGHGVGAIVFGLMWSHSERKKKQKQAV